MIGQGSSAAPAPSRNPRIEGVRGVAALLVFLVHYESLADDWVVADSWTYLIKEAMVRMAHMGTELFFLTSGFLIYANLWSKPQSTLRFFKRRVQRIYPAFAVMLGVYLLIMWVFPEQSKLPADSWSAFIYVAENALLLPGIIDVAPIITVTWSLSYLATFYIIAPVLVNGLALRTWPRSARVALFVAVGAAFMAWGILGGGMTRMATFFAGMVLFEAVQVWPRARDSYAWIGAAAVLVTFLVALSTLALPPYLRHIAVTLLSPAALYGCLGGSRTMSGVVSHGALRTIGAMCLSVFLVHGLVLKVGFFVVHRFIGAGEPVESAFWWFMPVMLAAALAASWLFYVVVEQRTATIGASKAMAPVA